MLIWWPPILSELIHITFNIELTHLGLEASINIMVITLILLIFLLNYEPDVLKKINFMQFNL